MPRFVNPAHVPRDEFGARLREFDKLKQAPHEEKLLQTRAIIAESVREFQGQIAVACSFGKDSEVVTHLALQVDSDIPVVFCNTLVEYPDTIAFKKRLKEEWDLNLFEFKPEKTFGQCLDQYGPPHFRYGKKGDGRKSGAPRCCWYLKEKPAYEFYKKHGIKATFLGLTWDESYQRRSWIIGHGTAHTMKTRCPGLTKIYPIAYWTTEDVWRYIRDNNLPYNSIYDKGHDRCGCWPCTGFKNWERMMAKEHPKFYARMKELMGQRVLDHFYRSHIAKCRGRG